MWLGETEGAQFWLSVFNELKTRGVQDCFIVCVEGLRGLPEAIETVYPHTPGSAVYRASGPQQPEVCHLERPETGGRGSAVHLHGADGGGRPGCAGGVCRTLGGAVSGDHAGLGAEFGAPDAVFRLSAGYPQDSLHHQCH